MGCDADIFLYLTCGGSFPSFQEYFYKNLIGNKIVSNYWRNKFDGQLESWEEETHHVKVVEATSEKKWKSLIKSNPLTRGKVMSLRKSRSRQHCEIRL